MNSVETIIIPRWIIPVMPEAVVWENHAVVLDGGKIKDILPAEKVTEQYRAQEVIQLPNHAILPGFINTHTHTPMTLFRGLADDLKLMDWLQNHIWPAEKKWLSDVFCYDGARLAIVEMIKSGTTCFNENYFFLDSIGKAVSEAGMRASLGVCVLDFETAYAKTCEEYLEKAKNLISTYAHQALISVNVAPHAPYTLSDKSFDIIKQFAEENNVILQIHLQESQDEIHQSEQQYKMRPLNRLYQLGVLSSKTQAVHMVHVNQADLALIQKTQLHIVHCPESNLKLASGFSPVQQFLENKINVALGTDGAASNNDLDMLGEMKTAAILAKAVSNNSSALNAYQALKMATYNGAVAMGIENLVGSVEKNKQADLIAIDLSYPNTQPVYHPISQIVYASGSHQISDVWIKGQRVLKGYQCSTLDQTEILEKANTWKNKIIEGERL